MQEKNILLCFLAVPLRHKLIAAVIALAIGAGFFAWSRHGMSKLTTIAEMWFDAGAAQLVEPAIMQAKEPAVALAQSILKDDVVKGLEMRTGVRDDVATFRSHLDLTQPSPNLLHVDYHDLDQQLSVAMANAIANLLVSWTPSPVVPNSAPVTLTPVVQPTPKVVSPHRHTQATSAQPDEIANLEAQLVATDQKLITLNAAKQKADAAPRPVSKETEHRRALEAQVSAAQKRLSDLRERYTDEYPDVEIAKENLVELQSQLIALGPEIKEPAPSDKAKPVDNSSEAILLRQERARLVQAIADERHRESLHARSLPTEKDLPAPVQAPLITEHPPVNAAVAPVMQSPFTLVRFASYGEPGIWWHGVVAGLLCGFLYLSSAVIRYLPIGNAVPQAPLAATNIIPTAEEAVRRVESSADFERWEREVKEALALTSIGIKEEAALPVPYEKTPSEPKVHIPGPEVKGQLQYEEVAEAIREKVKREPDGWVAHTEEARSALAGGDYDTAIKEMKLAVNVAPEKMRPQIDKIIAQLDKNVTLKQRAVYGQV
jgi:hypothetical protein